MSDSEQLPNTPTNPFDLNQLRDLFELMQEHEVNEVELHDADQCIRVQRGAVSAVPAPIVAQPQALPAATGAPAGGSAADASDDDDRFIYIKSQLVGTFYSRPKPEAEPYVRVGEVVELGSTVCIIEAMKVFNEVEAEISGRVVSILVEDGEHVDYDKPLIKLEKA